MWSGREIAYKIQFVLKLKCKTFDMSLERIWQGFWMFVFSCNFELKLETFAHQEKLIPNYSIKEYS